MKLLIIFIMSLLFCNSVYSQSTTLPLPRIPFLKTKAQVEIDVRKQLGNVDWVKWEYNNENYNAFYNDQVGYSEGFGYSRNNICNFYMLLISDSVKFNQFITELDNIAVRKEYNGSFIEWNLILEKSKIYVANTNPGVLTFFLLK